MAEIRHLQNAPIVEAIIEIGVKPHKSFDSEVLVAAGKALSDTYPSVSSGRLVEFQTEGESPEVVDHGFQAIKAESTDGLRVVQFRKDSFAFSRQRTYTNWNNIYEDAINLWWTYVEMLEPDAVTKLSVRYINHISIPLGSDIDDYLAAGPRLPDSLPQQVHHFLTNLVCPYVDDSVMINLTQAANRALEDDLRIVLDIEAFQHADLDPKDDTIAERFSLLRKAKNEFFFNLVTEKTLERYA